MIITFLYLVINCLVVWRVGLSLYKNGRHYLELLFNVELAIGLNKILLMGYYLLNLGLVIYTMASWPGIATLQELIEALVIRSGAIFVLLGSIHIFNLIWLMLYSGYRAKQTMNH